MTSVFFFFSSRRRHTRYWRDWSSDVCSSDLVMAGGEHQEKLALFAGIDGARFRRQVLPGDVLTMEVEIERLKGRAGRGTGRATVGDERVCEAELMFAFAERGQVK